MKKFNTILAIAAVAVSSVFGLTSCDKDSDSYSEVLNPRTEVVNENQKEPEVQHYTYEVNGMWRFESNGVKYTMYVDVPKPEKGGFHTVKFYFDGKSYNGDIKLDNDVLTFKTYDNEKSNITFKATFANKDSQEFTAEELTIDNTTVATDATFSRIDTPTSYEYKVSYVVVDPDNELASMGLDLQQLNDEMKQFGNIIQTHDLNPIKALISMGAQKVFNDLKVSTKMIGQCKDYPALANSKVYVDTKIEETFGDVTTAVGSNPYTYATMGE